MSSIIPVSALNSAYQMSGAGSCETVSRSGLPVKPIPRRKIHCILPSSPWLADSKTNIPLGVLYIAGLLRAQGHDVVVTSMLDKRYEGNIHLPDHVMDSDVHMFGFCTPQFGEALELAAYIKDRRPEALLVAGGPHPSYEPKEVKEAGRQEQYHYKGVLPQRRDYRAPDGRTLFDTVVVMEGEVAVLQMLTDWDAGQLQPYYYGDKADAMDLDAIPFPAWDLLPDDHIYNDGVAVMKHRYFPNEQWPESSGAVMSLIGTRGCPYKCFAAGTLVDMADGTQVPVQNIRAGDLVQSFDPRTGARQVQPVTRVGMRSATDVWRLTLEDGTSFTATGDHPFITPQGWREVADLRAGDTVRRVQKAGGADVARPKDRQATAARQQNVFARVQPRGYSSLQARRSEPGEAPRGACTDLGDGKAACARTLLSYLRPTSCRQNTSRALDTRATPSRVGADEARQPYAQTGGYRSALGVAQAGLQRRANAAARARSVLAARACAFYSACRGRFAPLALWGSALLDWALPVWPPSQSRYAAPDGASGHPLLWPVLAYAGGYSDSTAGLCEHGLVSASPVGGVSDGSPYGPCPREQLSGDWVRVRSVTFMGRDTVYPVSVANTETFIVDGYAVHNCTYCSTPWIGQKPRYRSSHNIISEMAQVMDKGVRMFKFQDDTYTLHKTKLRALAEDVHRAFGKDSFAARIHTRVNTMDDHVAESLKLLNCKVTCFGIESGSQRVLDANQKGTKIQQNTDAIIKAKEHGFYTIAFLVIGMAGETMETMKETQDWLLSVKPYLDSCNLAVGIPYPGSRWWTHPQESGIDILDYNFDNQWIVGFSARNEIIVRPHGCTVEEMFRIKQEMFDFLVYHGWAKAEWDEDVRIRKQQEEAAATGVLTAASTLTYAGH